MNIKSRGCMICLIVFLATLSASLMAANTTALPWESPLNNLAGSLTGPTAKAIALIGLFVAGGLLVFGGELSDFGRRITWMCLAVSVMLAGSSFLDIIGPKQNATALVLEFKSPALYLMV